MKRPIVVTQELDPDREQAETLALIARLETVRDGQAGAARAATEKTIATMRRGLAAAQDSFAGIRHRAIQREKGKKAPHVAGRTMRDVIADEARQRPGVTPLELLPYVNYTALEIGLRQISLKRLKNVLAESRRK